MPSDTPLKFLPPIYPAGQTLVKTLSAMSGRYLPSLQANPARFPLTSAVPSLRAIPARFPLTPAVPSLQAISARFPLTLAVPSARRGKSSAGQLLQLPDSGKQIFRFRTPARAGRPPPPDAQDPRIPGLFASCLDVRPLPQGYSAPTRIPQPYRTASAGNYASPVRAASPGRPASQQSRCRTRPPSPPATGVLAPP